MLRSSSMTIVLLLLCSACSRKASKPAKASKEDAIAAFENVRAVLQHPRCQNCHPAGDAPLQGDDGHLHTQNIKRGPKGHGMAGAACTTCHGPGNPPNSYGTHIPPGVVDGWHMPEPEMKLVFVGVAPHELCEQIKNPETNGHKSMEELRKHLDTPLVLWGWNPGAGRAPVSIPYQEFIQAWETWADAGAPCPE